MAKVGVFFDTMKYISFFMLELNLPADDSTIKACKIQLEFLFWSCKDVDNLIVQKELDKEQVSKRISLVKAEAHELKLDNRNKLIKARIVDNDGYTICPLCLKRISAIGFCNKILQAEGREIPDPTVTEVSLFHIHELRTGEFNHRPYNLGWGHHHCNVVVKDAGIQPTLKWMKDILKWNRML